MIACGPSRRYTGPVAVPFTAFNAQWNRSVTPAWAGMVPPDVGRFVFSSSQDRTRNSRSAEIAREHVFVSWASSLADGLFAALFPSDCRLCGNPLVRISRLPVCDPCLAEMRPMAGGLCSICGESLATGGFSAANDEARCALCRRLEPPFARAVAYGSYEGGLRELIHLLKYQQVRTAANVLGRMLAEAIADLAPSLVPGTVVVPVPLFHRKARQRGFNQSELIARIAVKLSSTLPLQLDPQVLVRTRETESQIGLTRHQRRENMRGAFAVARPEHIAGRDVILVDDVFTTGTTASECARVLRRAGASRVWVATVARTLKLEAQHAVPPSRVEHLAMAASG